ncbi:MAG TPA: acyl-CoA thioesterase [Dissulfurispiraceae bacterium]|nr:acyl-CoA thioesterase [Dissulfurispiraceae bacterium]
MENYKLVLPEHLNQFGYLFGGNLLKWVDEIAWIAASLDFPGCTFVTIGMDRVEFRKSVKEGSILRFVVEKAKIGKTSVQYAVNVFNEDKETEGGDDKEVFSTHVTFVCLDNEGSKADISFQSQG